MDTVLKAVKDDEDRQAEDWLHQASDAIVSCRGESHEWPRLLDRRRKSARYLRLEPPTASDGVWQLLEVCKNCGKKRRVDTQVESNGARTISLPAKFRYEDPPGYKAPKGVRISRRMAFAESWRRAQEDLMVEARKYAEQHPDNGMVMGETDLEFIRPGI